MLPDVGRPRPDGSVDDESRAGREGKVLESGIKSDEIFVWEAYEEAGSLSPSAFLLTHLYMKRPILYIRHLTRFTIKSWSWSWEKDVERRVGLPSNLLVTPMASCNKFLVARRSFSRVKADGVRSPSTST